MPATVPARHGCRFDGDRPNSVTWAQSSSYDHWDYRQALVLLEAFDDPRASPRMEAVLERLRAKFGVRFAKRHELKGSDDCDGSRPDVGAPRNRMTGSTIMVNSEALTSQFGCSYRPGRSAWRRRTLDLMRASHELQGAVGARPCNRPPALAVVVAHCVASSVGEYSSLASTH